MVYGTPPTKTPRTPLGDYLPQHLEPGALSATYVRASAAAPDPAVIAAYVDTSAVPAVLKVWSGTAWVVASGSGGAPATPIVRQIANRTMVSTGRTLATVGGRTGKTDWVRHLVTIGGTKPRVVVSNVAGTGAGTAAVTYGAAIDIGGVTYPFTFGGQAKVTLQPGTAVTSDPIAGLTVPTGFVKTRIWTDLAVSTDKFPTGYGMYLQAANDGTTRDTTGADLTLAGSGSAFNAANSAGTGPVGLLAEVAAGSYPAFAIAGDSILEGFQDTPSVDQTNSGFGVRGISAANRPYINYAVSSDKVQLMTAARRAYWYQGIEACTHVLCDLAINDITGSRTLAQIQADLIDLWYFFSGKGLKTRHTTIGPRTTSTDAFATEANQTIANAGQETVRLNLNLWLRDGAPIYAGNAVATGSNAAGTLRAGTAGHPLEGILDTAATVESVANPGKWKYTTGPLTADGLHPTPLGYSLMAVPVQTWAAAATV